MKKKFSHLLPVISVLFLLPGLFFLSLSGHDFLGLTMTSVSFILFFYYLLLCYQVKEPKRAGYLIKALSIFLSAVIFISAVTFGFVFSDSMGDDVPYLPYLLVLGAGVNGSVPSLSLRDRLEATLEYLLEHPETICIVSGGKGDGENLSEAQCMFDYLIARGIPEERIWMEDKATSTKENIRFTLDLIKEKTGETPAVLGILSSEYHLFRAKYLARSFGIDPVGVPAITSMLTVKINYFLREIPAVLYYCVLGG